jgi:phosphoserine phosphatase
MSSNNTMGTVIFDFDSTLIKSESMEVILSQKLSGDLGKIARIAKITKQGMNGDIDFFSALRKRLAIATPSKSDIDNFVHTACPGMISKGFPELIEVLKKNKIDIWVLSGGLEESIFPFSDYLGIERNKVHAVQVNWYQDGYFKSLNKCNGFAISKLKGASGLQNKWKGPVVIVGDGYTDYSLYEEGLVDDFIAYVEHTSRPNVLSVAKHIASSGQELSVKLKELLKL